MGSACLAAVSAIACVLVSLVNAGGQVAPAGTRHPVTLEAPQDYSELTRASKSGAVWSHVLCHTGATYVAVHFADFDLGPGDSLTLSDPKGEQSFVLTGQGKMNAGNFWAQHVKGDTLVLQLVLAGAERGRGFLIDQYSVGLPLGVAEVSTKTICGADDKANARCYTSSHPTEYARAQAVARLLVHKSGGDYWGTGFLVSQQNHLLTARHLITSAQEAVDTDFEFMAETPNCSSYNCEGCYGGSTISGSTLIRNSSTKDYSLVRLSSGDPASNWGYLELESRAPVIGERVYIPQHPQAYAKQIAIYSSQSSDVGGVCQIRSLTVGRCVGSGLDAGYYADTDGGSSGSPVLASSSHRVIALHHCGGCLNGGVPMSEIWNEIKCDIQSQSIAPTSWTAPAEGGSTTVNVSSESGCGWSVSNPCNWITVNPRSGTGSGSVTVSVGANPGCTARSCTVTIAGSAFIVTQNGGSGIQSISPTTWTVTAAGGSTILNVTATSGCPWTVTPCTDWLTASPTWGSGNGNVTISASPNRNQAARNCFVLVTGASGGHVLNVNQENDSVRPAVAITSPRNKTRLLSARTNLTGTAWDSLGLARVRVQVGTNTAQTASGTTNWSAAIELEPGTNVVQAWSVDLAGNKSFTNRLKLIRVVPVPLTLATNGCGSITSLTNGQLLETGSNYTVTASPCGGFLFSNWCHGFVGDLILTPAGDAPTLSFTMETNLLLQANLVPSPFVKATFSGLFYDTNQPSHESSGFFTLSLTRRGTYTAELLSGTNRWPLTGQFGLDGRAINTFAINPTNLLAVEWIWDANRVPSLFGRVIGSDTAWEATLASDRDHGLTDVSRFAGKYTFIIPGSHDPALTNLPTGDGFGTVIVATNGGLTLAGKLTDGKALTQGVTVSTNGWWPLYVPLYAGRGSLFGWIQVATNPAPETYSLLGKAVHWTRPALTNTADFPNGFEIGTSLLGSTYRAKNLVPLTNGLLNVVGGGLAAPFTAPLSNCVVLTTSTHLVMQSPSNGWALTVTRSNGLFTGTLWLSDTNALNLKGAVLQRPGFGAGFFKQAGQSGQVYFGPVE